MQFITFQSKKTAKLKRFLGDVESNSFPSGKEEDIQRYVESGWITDSEAEIARRCLSLRARRSYVEGQLSEHAKIKSLVDTAQERIRKNIEALSKDGIKDNPILTRYLTGLSLEEDKYSSSCLKEVELGAEKNAISEDLANASAAFKTSLMQRYLTPLK